MDMRKVGVFVVVTLFLLCNSCQRKEVAINVGVVLPLTGTAAEIGNNILDGIKIANEYYNENSETKIKLIVEDSKLDAKTTISATNKLIYIDKVFSVIGLASSTESLSAAPICEANKIVMISSTASTPLLTTAGDYIFRIYPSDIYDGKILADFSYSTTGLKNMSILYLNNDFGTGLKDAFSRNYVGLGGTIDAIETFSPDDIDFKTQLTKIKRHNSAGLLIIAIDMQYLNIIKQVRELNIQSQPLAPVTFDNPLLLERLGDAANGVIYTRPVYNLNSNSNEDLYFKEKYKALKNVEPPLLTALGFDTFSLLYKALESSEFDKTKVKECLKDMDFQGVSGRIIFDENGDIIPEIEIMRITNNQSIRYE
jgi:branched-chain amino acid transport system substrate-binding protein